MESLQKASRELRNEFEELIVQFRPDLWRYCLYLTRSAWDAEDLAQETIVKAFAHMSHLYQTVNTRAYLFRIASNLWIDWCRRARLVLDGNDAHASSTDVSGEVDGLDILDSLEELIRLLPPRQRVVLLLVDVFDFTAKESAAMLSISEGAVKAALHRARTTLRTNVRSEPGGPHVAKVPSAIVDAYVKAFNDRDPDAIAALLDETAVADIVGVTQEYGRHTIRKHSLSEWAQDPVTMRATYTGLNTDLFIAVLIQPKGKEEGLSTVIRLEESGQRIHCVQEYYFCPELLKYIADKLQVPAYTHGYFWNS